MEDLIFNRALCFAAQAHAFEVRKGTLTPYIVHPFETAMILQEANCSKDLIIAGLFHDILENTSVSKETMENEFGKHITELVICCTENKNLSWEERKQNTIDFIKKEADEERMLLVCADKLSNLRSMLNDYDRCKEELWTRFNRGKEKQAWYYGEMIAGLSPIHSYRMYDEIKTMYNRIFP